MNSSSTLRHLTIIQIRLAQTAMHHAAYAIEQNQLQRAVEELQLAAMRGEEAAKLLARLRKSKLP